MLMKEYGIVNIRRRRDLQLMSFMYNESQIPNNLNQTSTNIVLRSSKKVRFKEK